MKRAGKSILVVLCGPILVGGVYVFFQPPSAHRSKRMEGEEAPKMRQNEQKVISSDRGEKKSSISEKILPLQIRVSYTQEDLIDGFPAMVTIYDGDQEYQLQYTGSFLDSKDLLGGLIVLKLYWIASYVESPVKGNTDELLAGLLQDGPRKLYLLRFANPLPGGQIMATIQKNVDETFTDVDMDRLGKEIDRFVQGFSQGASTGEEVYLAWLPEGRIFNGFETKNLDLIAQDVPLARAIWRIWAGEKIGPDRVGLVKRFGSMQQESRQ